LTSTARRLACGHQLRARKAPGRRRQRPALRRPATKLDSPGSSHPSAKHTIPGMLSSHLEAQGVAVEPVPSEAADFDSRACFRRILARIQEDRKLAACCLSRTTALGHETPVPNAAEGQPRPSTHDQATAALGDEPSICTEQNEPPYWSPPPGALVADLHQSL